MWCSDALIASRGLRADTPTYGKLEDARDAGDLAV